MNSIRIAAHVAHSIMSSLEIIRNGQMWGGGIGADCGCSRALAPTEKIGGA